MRTLGRRLIAIAAVVMVTVTNLPVCAGWQATPEARMDCCADETNCPMHQPESHKSGSKRLVSQREADACCAVSQQTHSAKSGSVFVLSASSALALSAVPFIAPPAQPTVHPSGTLDSSPISSVAKHLLLSVLLV